MIYNNMVKGIFISRPNRFIANVVIDGKMERAHVKNTGRCRELLYEGAAVYLQHHDNVNRNTAWSLISVEKGNRLVNIDSQAPNKVVSEWLRDGRYKNVLRGRHFLGNIKNIRPEYTYENSRIDFFAETDSEKALIEVKGVTLETNNIAMFPDAPTERGARHVYELAGSIDEGYKAFAVFVIQMEGVEYFTPNVITHKAFADALIYANEKGVHIIAVDCSVGKDFLSIRNEVDVVL